MTTCLVCYDKYALQVKCLLSKERKCPKLYKKMANWWEKNYVPSQEGKNPFNTKKYVSWPLIHCIIGLITNQYCNLQKLSIFFSLTVSLWQAELNLNLKPNISSLRWTV